jgi:hypothetical protein
VGIVGIVGILCLMPQGVRGDDESDRNQYMSEIRNLLDGMKSDLSSAFGDSGTSSVDYSIRKASEVKSKAERLKGKDGGNSDARKMADDYPSYVDRFNNAAGHLRSLKEGQKSLDEYPRRCDEKTRELVAKMRGYSDGGDPRGMEEVPKLAREYGRIGRESIEQAERKKNEMSQWYDRVNNFSDDHDRWSGVKSALQSADRSIWEYFNKQYENIKRDEVCGNLAKEERNPLVEQEMKKLVEGKKGIAMIYESMDRQLAEIAAYLNDLEADSNASDIDYAERKADDLERNIDQLDRIKGQDGEARSRVELYRNILRSFRDATKQLRTLKQGQFLVDRAPEKCSEAQHRLIEQINGYKDRRDSKGVKEIPLRARAAAEPIKASLAKADEHHPLMERAVNDVLRFDPSEGRWRDVRSNVKDSVDGIWDYWKKARETAHKSCDELAKGDEMQVVKAAIEILKGSSNTQIEAYRKDVDAWFDLSREAFKLDCVALQELWSAWCEGVDWESKSKTGEPQARAVSDRIRASREAPGRQLLELYEELKKRGEQLRSDNEVGDQAEKLLDQIRKRRYGAVEKMIKNGAVLGYQHPLIQFSQKYGMERHLDLMTSSTYSCDVADEPIEGTGSGDDPGRPDCISADQCTIWEFKPKGKSGEDAYKDQEGRYRRGVNAYLTKHMTTGTVPSVKGGQQLVDKLRKNTSCWDASNKETKFEVKPYYYDVCEKRYECVAP